MAKFFPRAPVQRWALRIFMASSAMAEVWFSQELWTGGAGGHVFKHRFGLTYKLQSTATARRRFWVCRFMCPPVNEVIRPKVVNFNLHVVWFCKSKFATFLKIFESLPFCFESFVLRFFEFSSSSTTTSAKRLVVFLLNRRRQNAPARPRRLKTVPRPGRTFFNRNGTWALWEFRWGFLSRNSQ